MLKEKSVNVGGTDYLVRELTIGQMLPLMEQLSGDESNKAQLKMVSLSVCDAGGVQLGDKTSELGLSAYMELSKHVMDVNGMGEAGNE